MPSLCPVCQETFVSWTDYHEHISLAHAVKPTPAQVIMNAAKPIQKGRWTGPMDDMDKAEKRRITVKGELRIGQHYFVGGAL